MAGVLSFYGARVTVKGENVDIVVVGLDIIPCHYIPVQGFQIVSGDDLQERDQ